MDQTHVVVPRPVSRHDDNGRGRLRGEGGQRSGGEVAGQSVLIVKCDHQYKWEKGSQVFGRLETLDHVF